MGSAARQAMHEEVSCVVVMKGSRGRREETSRGLNSKDHGGMQRSSGQSKSKEQARRQHRGMRLRRK